MSVWTTGTLVAHADLMEDKTLSLDEVAQRLSQSIRTVRQNIANGTLTATTGKDEQRITVAEFERYRDHLMATMVAATSDELEADLKDT